ncbi:MAG: RHS repeat-associated core domain-containing protein [Bacteroidota bacterium]
MKKFIALITFTILLGGIATAQIITGGDSGNSNTSQPEAQTIKGENYSSVNPFTGLLSITHPLGSVSSKEGLSFQLSLNYSSSISTGSTNPNVGGILYGKGWNLNIPMVTVKTEDYHKYSFEDYKKLSQDGNNYDPALNANTPVFNREPDNQGSIDNDCEEAKLEGKLFWFSPVISLPGIGSKSLVYQEYEAGRGFKFIPHKFETYFECYLNSTAAGLPTWEAVLSDGTIYKFEAFSVSHRDASNQRVQMECMQGADRKETLANLVLPKAEISSWYCVEISHPLKVDKIEFSYSTYGDFQSNDYEDAHARINNYFFNGNKGNELEKSYRKVVLDEISSDLEKLTLNYEHLTDLPEAMRINENENTEIIDNLYAKERVKYYSGFGGGDSFNDWHRYLHQRSANIFKCGEEPTVDNQGLFIQEWMSSTNPYLGISNDYGFETHVARQKESQINKYSYAGMSFVNNTDEITTTASDLYRKFDGGYLESNGISLVDLVRGDEYILDFSIRNKNEDDIFDYNIVVGDNQIDINEYPDNGDETTAQYYYMDGECYNYGINQSIISSFNKSIKLHSKNPASFFKEHSTNFTLRSLPTDIFENVRIQIGPGNSDNKFTHSVCNANSQEHVFRSYFNIVNLTLDDIDNEDFHPMNSGAKTPTNFGAGMPWFMISDYYNNDYVENPNGAYNDWWEYCPEKTWCLHENKPIVFHNAPDPTKDAGPELHEVTLTRYFERPYQLKTVSKERRNTDGNFIIVDKLGMDYTSEVLGFESYYTRTDRYNPDDDITKAKFDGNRYDILLSKVKRLTPNASSTYDNESSTNPTTHFEYEIKSYSTDEFVSNFSVVSLVKSPLGHMQKITYDDPDFEPVLTEMNIEGTLNSGVGYSDVVLNLSRRRTFWRSAISPHPSDLNCLAQDKCADPNQTGNKYENVNIPSGEISFTVNMAVKALESEDSNGPKRTDYEYMGEINLYESYNLTNNFIWDQGQYGAWQRGFGECKIFHPGDEGQRPYTINTYSTDNLKFGKLERVRDYTGKEVLVNDKEYVYEEQLVFSPDWSGGIDIPDFVATDGMYDAPLFYNTRFLNENSEINKSYFVRLVSDSKSMFLNGAEISFDTEYSYFDMDVSNSGYSEMGITTLDEFPSFQLYSTEKTSSEFAGYAEKTENFYLYDYVNGNTSNGEVTTATERNIRTLPFQTRVSLSRNGTQYSNSSFIEYFSNYLVPQNTYTQISNGTYVGLHSSLNGEFKTLRTQEVISLNSDFQIPREIIDVMGRTTILDHYTNGNVNLKTTTAPGVGTVLTEEVTYFSDNDQVRDITDQTGLRLEFEYDFLNRLAVKKRNGKILEEIEYSNWDNTNKTFNAATAQNYIKTTEHIEAQIVTNTKYSYVNPEGNKVGTVWDGAVIEDLLLDQYGRVKDMVRPHAGSLPTLSGGTSASHQQYMYDDYPIPYQRRQSDFGFDVETTYTETETSYVPLSDMVTALSDAGASYTDDCGSILIKVVSIDEDGKLVTTFSDILGNNIATINGEGKSATTFIYNERNLLERVTSPDDIVTDYSINYLGQIFMKNNPDCGIEEYAYNQSGTLIGKKTPLNNKIYGYDGLGRPIFEAISSSSDIYNESGNNWITTGETYAQTNQNQLSNVDQYITKSIYDGYSNEINSPGNINMALASGNASFLTGRLAQTISYAENGTPIETTYYNYNQNGFVTWNICQINDLGITSAAPGYMFMIGYNYNSNGSLRSQRIDINVDFTLDFNLFSILDNRGRLSEVKARYILDDPGGAIPLGTVLPKYTIAKYYYDDASNLLDYVEYYGTAKNLNAGGDECDIFSGCIEELIDVIDYDYNERYLLKRLSSNLFEEILYYDDEAVANVNHSNNYNDNVNGVRYTYRLNHLPAGAPVNFSSQNRNVGYEYDSFNRLTSSDSETDAMPLLPTFDGTKVGDTKYDYTSAGNLTFLNRGVYENADTKEYSYFYTYGTNTNRLTSIEEQYAGIPFTTIYSYGYDGAGNVNQDGNHDITQMSYFRDNLPYNVNTASGGAEYSYSSNHARIVKSVNDGTTISKEYYIKNAAGFDLGVYDVNSGNLTWYIPGTNRIAKVQHIPAIVCTGDGNGGTGPNPGFTIGELNREVTSSDYAPYFHNGRLYDRNSVNLSDVENASVMNMIDELVDKDVNGVITYDLPNQMIVEMQPDSTKRYHLQSNFTPDPSKSYISVDINTIGQVVPINVGLGEQVLVSMYDLLEDTYDFMSPTYYLSGAIYGSSHGHPLGDLNPHGKKEYHYVLPVQADYFIFDHLGSTRLIYHTVCEPSGDKYIYELDAAYDYFPFGKMLRDYEANEEKFLFTDKERDDETDYDNFGFRHYDSDICKFTSIDPAAGKYPGISPFAYVANNPISFIDPRGDTLRAVNQVSAERAMGLIQSGIPAASSAFGLFSLASDGVTFNSISSEALGNALSGLNADQAALVIGYAAMINGSETNVVEVVNSDETISEYGQNALSGSKTGADLINNSGGGYSGQAHYDGSIVRSGADGTYGIVTANSSSILYYNNGTGRSMPGETLAHEMLGHGLGNRGGRSDGQQLDASIQSGNIYRRTQGVTSYRLNHGVSNHTKGFSPIAIPSYLRRFPFIR